MPTNASSELRPRVAVVTGGSRGIGRSVVEQLACDGLNVVVVYAANRPDAEAAVATVESHGAGAIAAQADIADEPVYIERCDIAEVADPNTEKGKQEGVNPYAIDPEQAERLWRVSAQLTGIDALA